MTDRPILFSAPMIRALLDGRKTQARQMAWRFSTHATAFGDSIQVRPTIWQKVKPGDRLWVRETWQAFSGSFDTPLGEARAYPRQPSPGDEIRYRADFDPAKHFGRWRSSIHMPRWASRITLVVTDVRRHRLREITDVDARAQGFSPPPDGGTEWHSFLDFWNELHGEGATDSNPEVVALTFTVHTTNIDHMQDAA